VIVRLPEPLVVYVPETVLQSARAAKVPSPANVTVYRCCSSAGTTPWKSGVFWVNAVSCHECAVRPVEVP
jgi:hypothetical protein